MHSPQLFIATNAVWLACTFLPQFPIAAGPTPLEFGVSVANLEQVQLLTQILVTNARRHLNLHSSSSSRRRPHPPWLALCLCLLTWTLGTALHKSTQAKDNCSLVLLHHLQRKRERKRNRARKRERNVSKMCKIKLKFSRQRERATSRADALPLPLTLALSKYRAE